MPKLSKARSFEEILQGRFPQAVDLAFDRIFAGRSIFFDTKKHQALYAKDLIKAALYLAQHHAHEAGFSLVLNAEEKKLLQTTFSGPLLVFCLSGILLLFQLYDFFQ